MWCSSKLTSPAVFCIRRLSLHECRPGRYGNPSGRHSNDREGQSMNLRHFCAVSLCIGFVAFSLYGATDGPTQAELDAAARSSTNWIHPNHDYAGTRYVDLKQINAGNAASLVPRCMVQTKERVPAQTSPLVYDGTVYL